MNWTISQTVDLSRGYTPVVWPDALMVSGDVGAHTWRLTVLDNGVPANLSGATITGSFLRADGNTVLVSGTVSGNIASVTLTDACYAVEGKLVGTMRAVISGATVTLAAVVYTVKLLTSGDVVNPGVAYQDFQIDASPAGTYADLAALNADTAADVSKIYITLDDGKWCYHNGTTWVAGGVYQAVSIAADSVNTSNLVNDSVTFAKRTRLGEKAEIVLGTSTQKLPNIDVSEKTLTFYSTFFIINGNKRYTITDGVTIDITGRVDSGAVIVFFDTVTQLFVVLDPRNLSEAGESYILVAVISYNLHKDAIKAVEISCDFTVDDINRTAYFWKDNFWEGSGMQSFNSNVDLATIILGASANLPNYNTANRTLTFDGTFFILYGNERYTITGGKTFDFSDIDGSGILVHFDTRDSSFIISDARWISLPTSAVLIATLSTSHTPDPYLKSLYMSCPYTVDGKDSNSEVVNEFHFPIDPLTSDYTPKTVNGTDFTEATTMAQDVYDKYDELMAEYPDFITRELLGQDQSNTFPIYKYEIKPPAFSLRKKLPKVILNSGLHGAKPGYGDYKTMVFALYFFIKDVMENLHDVKYNTHFVIVPIANPWGFDNNERTNSRGVDLNRNFDHNWTLSSVGDNYSGASPFSEQETIILRDLIDSNKDAVFHADIHTRGGSVNADNMLLLLPNIGSEWVGACINAVTKVSSSFRSKYDLVDSEYHGKVSVGTGSGIAKCWVESVAEIPSLTFEGFPGIVGHPFTLSDETILNMNTEMIGVWFILMYEYFKKKLS